MQSKLDQSFGSRIACAHCKLSQFDVGGNELSAAVLTSKMAEKTIDSIFDPPAVMQIVFLEKSCGKMAQEHAQDSCQASYQNHPVVLGTSSLEPLRLKQQKSPESAASFKWITLATWAS